MHEPAGVVEILVQNEGEYPLFWSTEYLPPPQNENCKRVQIREFQNTPILKLVQNPPPKWKFSESPNLRVSEYPPNENCQRVQIWEFQNTPILKLVQNTPLPKNENCQRVQIREFQNTPSKMKIVRESKSESFRIPLFWSWYRIPPSPKMKIVRESKSESFRIPPQMKIVRESKSESFRIPLFWSWYRIPPPQWKLSESPSLRVQNTPILKLVQNTPPNENCQRVQIWEFQNTPILKLLQNTPPPNENCQRVQIWEFRIPLFWSWYRIPPPNENCQRVQIWEFQKNPILKLVQNTPLPPILKTSDFKLQNSLQIRRSMWRLCNPPGYHSFCNCYVETLCWTFQWCAFQYKKSLEQSELTGANKFSHICISL